MALKLYPVGIQTFEEIVRRNLLYVDKTEYVYRMTHGGGKYFFLCRPRRFGKSLLTSTFLSYFEGKKELFKGLAIERLETEWNEHPVLHFSMAGGKHMEKEQLQRYLLYILKTNEDRYGIANDSADPNIRLSYLINALFRKTGRQVVVLIDEYDAPLLDVVHEEENLNALRNVMRNFYSPLKDCEPCLRFVFLIGITKFSQLSIFSELNNISNVSMLDCYWFTSGTPTYLINMMRKFGVVYTDFAENMEADASDFDAPTETMTTLTPLLYQSGYITIKDYDKKYRSYTLGIPNREVRIGLTKALSGLPVVKVAINFDMERHTIADWKVQEA